MGADEAHKSEQDENVTLSFTGTDVHFHCGPAAISIPGDRANCCKLLASLREESDAAENIPVALSFDALKAWVAFLEGRQSNPKSPQGRNSQGRKSLSDTTLLQALEVSTAKQITGMIARLATTTRVHEQSITQLLRRVVAMSYPQACCLRGERRRRPRITMRILEKYA